MGTLLWQAQLLAVLLPMTRQRSTDVLRNQTKQLFERSIAKAALKTLHDSGHTLDCFIVRFLALLLG